MLLQRSELRAAWWEDGAVRALYSKSTLKLVWKCFRAVGASSSLRDARLFLSVLRSHHWCLTGVWDASNEGRELNVFTLEKVLLYSYPCLLLSVAVADLGWADRCLSGPHESSLSNRLQSHDAEC